MDSQISQYLSVFKFKVSIRYVGTSTSPQSSRKDELAIDTAVLDTCPSVHDLSKAIEKKINRSDTLKMESNIVPLCMVLLSSRLYSINSKSIEGVSDGLIERCWECLETVSHSVYKSLQDWLSYAINDRNAVTYAMFFIEHRSSPTAVKKIPNQLPRSIRFDTVDTTIIDVPNQIWHRDDVIHRTMMAHMSSSMAYLLDKSKRVDEK